jgi:6-pyruvoyltetrahydropterin/6-carboxytetrahydropterin synthase
VTEVFVEVRFEAAHYLPRVPPGHKCANLHGHSYLVTIRVAGEVGHRGWVIDYADIKAAWQPLFDRLDHHCLNELDGLSNSTSENLARWIFERLGLPGLTEVEVRETATAGCRYRGPA